MSPRAPQPAGAAERKRFSAPRPSSGGGEQMVDVGALASPKGVTDGRPVLQHEAQADAPARARGEPWGEEEEDSGRRSDGLEMASAVAGAVTARLFAAPNPRSLSPCLP
eukprot:2016048-Rhodomonas_salina.1